MLGTLVPAILCFVVFLLLLVYPLNKKRLAELSEKLEIKGERNYKNETGGEKYTIFLHFSLLFEGSWQIIDAFLIWII